MSYIAPVETDAERLRTQVDLEWPELLERVARFAVSESGRKRVLALSPAPSRAVAALRQTTLGEAKLLHSLGSPLPVRRVDAVQSVVLRAEKEGILSGEELFALGKVLDSALELFRFAKAHAEVAPTLLRALEVDVRIAELSKEIAFKIEEGGRVADRASSGVRDARREVLDLTRRVKRELDELIHRHRDALQDAYFAERDGRMVLPVRADAPYRIDGSVLGTSASGATLYVEPRELSPLLNKLRLTEERLRREEEQVRRELSAAIAPLGAEVTNAGEVCALADFLAAAARFSEHIRARAVPFADTGEAIFLGARHPLLADRGEVVAFDAGLAAGKGLVLSGPNAGGKTVTLKTFGLIALMQSSGLLVPLEEGSQVPFFEGVLSDIGDDQSLSRSLSTFSGHVERVGRMLAEARPGVLVLFDELMAGTDPMEGAALAVALAEEFVRRGASFVVTTHYESLKALASSDERFQNAAVGFDFIRMQPTFEVQVGRAAGSSALIVAERHGLAVTLTARARELLPEIVVRIEQDRRSAEATLVEVLQQKKALQTELERQRLLTHNLEREQERLREARRRALEDEGDTLRAKLREARRELERRRLELREAGSEKLSEIARTLDDVNGTFRVGGELDRALRKPTPTETPKDFSVGSKVRIVSLGLEGEVLEALPKEHFRVLSGGMKLSVPRHDLAQSSRRPEKTEKRGGFPATRQEELRRPEVAPPRTEDVTLDLRGQRVEAGLSELDAFIDELLRRRESGGYVLHGHGTGAMKDAVRSHVADHPAVFSSRPAERGEGGDAFTVIWVGQR